MTDPINVNNRLKAPVQPTEQRSKGASDTPAARTSANGSASDVVDLSSDKALLQVSQLPDIDSSKVERIKTALANGDYQPDPEVIARKFAEIEKLLPG